MRNILLISTFLAIVFLFQGCNSEKTIETVNVIPQPVKTVKSKGKFTINPETSIVYNDSSLLFLSTYAAELLDKELNIKLPVRQNLLENEDLINLEILENQVDSLGDEGYFLDINPKKIQISANTPAGVLYGIQTVYQLFGENQNGELPSLQITDYPRFSYRGMHLDVARHFMPIEFIYKVIDYLAIHKMNTFHWHLTDDQGWRIEIKKYPKLTEVGAWRVDMENLHWNNRPLINDPANATYGGFYTQDQVKDVVAYAAQRNITVIPEIEMPAHVMSVLAAYPELSCTGENLGVPPGGVWPITHIFCAGNEKTFEFIEGVLAEIMEIFPSKYIHIGGDEADKTNWKNCKKCQKRIKDEGLKDEQELQSYFTKRIEKFLNHNGRVLIGWDEILEGGLAPNAVVMSWRGEQGGIEAAKHGNHVIMTPGSHCYFDHYQGDPAVEPLAIGGYTTLKKVYGYEPIPAELSADESKFVLGAQANLWTEYMLTPQHVEYMIFPRLAALSEVVWSPKESRNWDSFTNRMKTQYERYSKLGINYSKSAYQINVEPTINPEKKSLSINLSAEISNPDIRYTTDGSQPNFSSMKFSKPLEICKTTTIKSAIFDGKNQVGETQTSTFNIHKAFACEVNLEYQNRPKYDARGEFGLVDGISGSISYSDGNWKGFLGKDMVATIDLGEAKTVNSISVDALQNVVSWIFLPTKVSFEISLDGQLFTMIGTAVNNISPNEGGNFIEVYSIKEKIENVRFVRVHMYNIGNCPVGHYGEGNPAFLFTSEIIVE
ncbi:MAG TPA: family 20 glycosylhydrolase [Tenuifilaceae bacterium]|nr:family 20 glycosylhydrolase [Tenuifilaceae bacterium]